MATQKLTEALAALKTAAKHAHDLDHARTLNELRKIWISFEEPLDTFDRLSEGPLTLSIANAAIGRGLIRAVADSGKALSSEEVAEQVSAATVITRRVLRYLAIHGLVDEAGENLFAANSRTKAFAQSGFDGGVHVYAKAIGRALQAMDQFLEETNWSDMTDHSKTAYHTAFDPSTAFFDWVGQTPRNLDAFAKYMTIQRYGIPDWLSVFPTDAKIRNWKPDSTLQFRPAVFVDIGGGIGHQAIGFLDKHPNIGRIVLQDMKDVVDHAELPHGIEKQALDFFQPQPEQGAKFYYLRNILHDWPDDKVILILKNIVEAMGPDSEILIDEIIVPAQDAPWLAVTRDLMMGAAFAAAERTKREWEAILDAAGLKVGSIHQYTPVRADSITVAIKK